MNYNLFNKNFQFHDYLNFYENEIYSFAAKHGVNWNIAKRNITIGTKINKGVVFNKKDEGKICVWVYKNFTANGSSFPIINIYHSRTSTNQTWTPSGIPLEFIEPSINLFNEIQKPQEIIKPINHAIWNNAVSAYNMTYRGVSLKGVNARRGTHYKHGDCFIFPITNSKFEYTGYQLIYDQKLESLDGSDKQIIGKYKGNFVLLGDDTHLQNGLVITESIADNLKLFTAPKVPNKSIYNNNKNKAHVACLSSNNFEDVINQFIGHTPEITLAADNDLSDNGNHGLYTCIKLARKYGCKVIYPVENNTKCDFSNTLEFRKMKIDKSKIGMLMQDIEFAPNINLEKATNLLITYLSYQVPNKYSIKSATKLVKDLLSKRNYTHPTCIKTQFEMNLMFNRNERMNLSSYNINNEIVHHCKTHLEAFNKAIDIISKNPNVALVLPWGMGTGKTELMTKLIKHFSDKQHLYISPRKALVNDVCSKSNLVSYLSDYFEDEDSMAYCLNSILYTNVEKYDFLFADEIVALLNHLLLSSVSNRNDVFNSFVKAIRNVQCVLFADADFNQNTLDFINKYSDGKEVHIIKLDSTTVRPKVTQTPNVGVTYSKLKRTYSNNENCMVAVSTVEEGNNVVDALLEMGVDKSEINFIHSETEWDVQSFFDNINEESKKFRFLVYTTKMGTGVSITNNHYKYNYLISSGGLPTTDCLQMLGRNRCAVEWIICASTGQQDKYDIKRSECDIVNNTYQFYTVEQEDGTLKRTELGLLMKDKIIEANKDTNNSARNIFLDLMNKGFEIEYDDETKETKVESHKKERKDIQVDCILNANIISDEEEEYINKKGKPSKYRHELDKKKILRLTGKDDIDETDVRLLLSNSRCKQIEVFDIVNDSVTKNNDWDKMNQVTLEQRYSKSIIQELFTKIIKPFLDKPIDKETAKDICKLVNDNHHDLGENGFPNYSKEFIVPIRNIGKFLKQFGYELNEVERNQKDGLDISTYKIQPNKYIQECFNRKFNKNT
jgi:hypothetical protein